MSKLKVLLAFLGLLSVVITQTAHASILNSGDVAIVETQGSGDSFSWVALKDIPGGASFSWTDEGWLAAGGFRGFPYGEQGQNTITAPTGGIAAGTVSTVILTSGLGNNGESIMIYDGTSANTPTTNPGTGLIWGTNWGNGGWKSDATNSDTSALPAALIGFNTAAPNAAGVTYTGPTTGTQAELIANISNSSNWTSYTGNTWSGGNFTVVPEPSVIILLGIGVLCMSVYSWQRKI
jgi:uncharacterized protein